MRQSLPRFSALLFSTLMVLLAPFFFAHAREIKLPPNTDYRIGAREEETRNRPAENAAVAPAVAPRPGTCDVCSSDQAAALQGLLKQYKDLEAKGGWPQWKATKKTLSAGKTDPRVPALRQILTAMGDYQPSIGAVIANPNSANLFDTGLSTAVKHFQERHGLNVDGNLTATTQAALAVPINKRIGQIMSTIARISQRPIPSEGKFILVNLPGYTLYGFEGGKQDLVMRVIVGNRRNHTPMFDNEVTDVVFNPPWNVPVRIANSELIPKLMRNPDYFIRAGFTVTQNGEEVDPREVNPDNGSIHFRQHPGDTSALGKIKFNIPDDDDVYLHDTGTRKLFVKEDRAMSHGCVRLAEPRKLAYFVFGGMSDWTQAKIDHLYDSRTQRDVKVTHVPVHLVYWTAFVDGSGVAHFYNDVYNKDASQSAALDSDKAITVASK